MTEYNQKTMETVINNLMYLHPLLSKNLFKQVRVKANINPGLWFILGILSVNKKQSMSELGKKLSMPGPHVTVLVDKLVKMKLVERIPDTKDRRIVYVQLVPKGQVKYQKVKKDISNNIRQQLMQLKPEQLETLAFSSQQVKEILLLIFRKSTANETEKK